MAAHALTWARLSGVGGIEAKGDPQDRERQTQNRIVLGWMLAGPDPGRMFVVTDREPTVDATPSWGEYADAVRVSLRLADGGALDEYVHTVCEIQTASGRISRDDLVRDVQGIVERPMEDGGPIPFSLDVTERRFEWGASSAFLDMVMFIAENAGAAFIGGVVGAGAERVARKWSREFKAQHPDWKPFRLDEPEVLERTRWLIIERFGEAESGLELVDVELRPPDQGSASYQGAEWIYTCHLAILDGMVTVTTVRRSRRSD